MPEPETPKQSVSSPEQSLDSFPEQSPEHPEISPESSTPDSSTPESPSSDAPNPSASPFSESSKKRSWRRQAQGLLRSASTQISQQVGQVGQWLPQPPNPRRLIPAQISQKVAETAVGWFSVSEADMADILATVRSELPTTEALLVGKPQAGKSSIVRGLTGVSAEIVGEGFRPHTQHTQRYAYPSEDLPLLIFTDTVGLGDIQRETAGLVDELQAELASPSAPGSSRKGQAEASANEPAAVTGAKISGAKILILTVKINDFATEALRQIAKRLREQYPAVPCLLAVTCLHELYPTPTLEHPSYPPNVEAIARAFKTLKQDFAGLYDGAVLLDFTLEEDGYEPVFYGLEALQGELAELLPEAESRAIAQLVIQRDEMSLRLGGLYREVGRRYISAFAVMAATLAAVPLPFATMPVLTALQVSLVGALGKLYGQTLSPSQAGGVVSAIAGGFLAQAVGRELVKFIPGLGSVIAASWAAAYTWALGEGACVYFGDLMGGKTPDPDRIQQVMAEAFTAAKTRFTARE